MAGWLPYQRVRFTIPLPIKTVAQCLETAFVPEMMTGGGGFLGADARTYRGDVEATSFTLSGPHGYRKYTLFTRGKLYGYGHETTLTLTIRLATHLIMLFVTVGIVFVIGLWLMAGAAIAHFLPILPVQLAVMYGVILWSFHSESAIVKTLILTTLECAEYGKR